ncbi:pecanex-like protein 4 isoform X2 [Mercenaria mercenaria]|uniref:pecanex-like protein 4 isoform X2 n=1 Tax=Mercenaria mercenaria TaxID=6596 RepID=UPI00234E954F|nr:pecanex-like protein 4 isoform X2 [Mercenaria mercenaria]
MRKKKNLLAEEDEVDFISCCDAETLKFVIPPKKYKLNVLIHALVAGPMCGLGFRYLLPTTLNALYYNNTGATVMLFIFGWFTLLIAQYPLTTGAPPETATYRTTDILELSALMRSFYVYIFVSFDLLHRLLVMVTLSTCVFIGAYFIKVSLGTIILCALAGYLLSTDLGGLGTQLLALITRNRVSASRTDVREPDREESGKKFLWKWGIFEFLYHVVMLAVVCVIAGLLNKNSTSFSTDSWKILGYCIIGVCVLEKVVRDLQGVFIVFGLWRNMLFPKTVRQQRIFQYRKLWLTPLGVMRRGLVNWVGPFLMLSYLSVTITSTDPTSVSIRDHLDLATGVWYVFGTVRAFRWIWQSTVHALLELSVVHIVMVTMDTNTTVIKWGIPILAMLASLCRDRLYQLSNKLYFYITLLISSWTDKKQRRDSSIPIIVVSIILFPLIFGVIAIASALSVPLLPLFTLPLVLFSFPRHLRSWPEDVGGSANSCPDTNFYRQLAPELSKAFSAGFASGSIGEASPGNHYLVRFQDRLIWVMVLERGSSYCTINIKGLELQETSCHTVEAARIDDIFECAFEVPESICAVGRLNEYPLHCLTPLDSYYLNAYSDARNILTGIIDSPSSTDDTMKAFLRSLVWVLLKYVNKMKVKQMKDKKSAKFDRELSFIAQNEKHELKEINSSNNTNSRTIPQKNTALQPLVPDFTRETRSPTPPPIVKAKQNKMASSWGSLDSFTDSIFSDDGNNTKKKPSKPPAALKPIPARNKSPEIEDLFDELDIGLPAYDVTKPKPTPQKFGGAKSFGNAIYKPQTNLAGSPDFKSPYSSQLSLPKEWRELPLDNSQVSRLMNKFPADWYRFVLKTLDWSCEEQTKEKVLQDVMGDDALRNCYSQLTMACYSIFEGQGYSGPSLLYKCYMGEVSINAMWDWLGEHTDLQNLVKKAFRYGFKLMMDQMLLGEMTSDLEWQEALEEYDNDWYIGLEKDPEWTTAVLASTPNLFSIGHNNTQNTYSSRTLTLQSMDVSIGRLNPEVVRGQWANLALELLYMTNDDEERYSIQAHPVILRNLTVQAADPPLGYPIYSSKPISVPLL